MGTEVKAEADTDCTRLGAEKGLSLLGREDRGKNPSVCLEVQYGSKPPNRQWMDKVTAENQNPKDHQSMNLDSGQASGAKTC